MGFEIPIPYARLATRGAHLSPTWRVIPPYPAGLTDVTAGFFDKLVKQLEKGFSSMEADYAGQASNARKLRTVAASHVQIECSHCT